MDKFFIKARETTPEICLSPAENDFHIKGVSAPENVRELYYPVIEWLEGFIKESSTGEFPFNAGNPIKLQIDLEYFNSSSAKFIFDMLMKFKELPDKSVMIEWYYDFEDFDMKEAAMDFSSLVEMDFSYIEKSEKHNDINDF